MMVMINNGVNAALHVQYRILVSTDKAVAYI